MNAVFTKLNIVENFIMLGFRIIFYVKVGLKYFNWNYKTILEMEVEDKF